jgi:hypothetical protein
LLGQPILLLYNLAGHEYCYSSLPIESAIQDISSDLKSFFSIVTIFVSQIVRGYFADTANKLFVARTIRTGQENSNHARNRQKLAASAPKTADEHVTNMFYGIELINETNLRI